MAVFRSPSPPPFCERETQIVFEGLRNTEKFRESLQVLIAWLEKGKCTKKHSGTFFSLIQSSHGCVRRQRMERSRCVEEVEKAQRRLLDVCRTSEGDIKEIDKLFRAAMTQKVWDQFTKYQRNGIKVMKHEAVDLKMSNSEYLTSKRDEENMAISDDDEGNENGELFMWWRIVNSISEEKDKAHQVIKELKDHCNELQDEILKLKLELQESKNVEMLPNATENDSHLISLVTIFLLGHLPFGASIGSILSHLAQTFPTLNDRDVESFLGRYPQLFLQLSTERVDIFEKKWTYIGFGKQN